MTDISIKNLELQRKIIKAINEEIGTDIKQLSKLKNLYDETRTIYSDLKEKYEAEAPSKMQKTLQDVKDLSTATGKIEEEYERINGQTPGLVGKIDRLLDAIQPQLDMIDELEFERENLERIKTIKNFSENIEYHLQLHYYQQAIDEYNNFYKFTSDLQSCGFEDMISFTDNALNTQFTALKDKLSKNFQETLKLIQWPMISTNQEVLQSLPPPDAMLTFAKQFECLSKLVPPPKKLNDSLSDTHPVLSRFTPPNLAIQELISPLSKRFYYHFSGNRPTNRKDKPEWYLCQILQWIGDHVKFIETEIQPIYKPKDAFLEFSRGLVQLVVEKLIRDSMAYLEDDRLLAHAIGQVLEFETKLRTLYDYPSHQPSALLVLAQPQFFTRWLSLEKAIAVRNMDDLLSSESAWSTVLTEAEEMEEESKLTNCGEAFLQMLLAITDRYKILPQPGQRLQFLELQLELLDEFRIRLVQLAGYEKFLEASSKSSSNIGPILNTIAAIANVLDDWSDLPFFVQLHSYKVQTENLERMAAEALNSELSSLPWLHTQANIRDDQGSVFDSMIDLFKLKRNDLLHRLVEAVMLEVKAKSQPYRLDKWASLPSPDEFIQPSLSPTASPMLHSLAVGLQWLKDTLSSSLFNEAWQKLASEMNLFLLEELILQRQFNDGGSAQLNYDVQHNLIPLFSQWTNRAENYFKELKDACTVLRIAKPIAFLLLDTLALAVQSEDDNPRTNRAIANAKQALKDQGIRKLNIEDSLSVLRHRIL